MVEWLYDEWLYGWVVIWLDGYMVLWLLLLILLVPDLMGGGVWSETWICRIKASVWISIIIIIIYFENNAFFQILHDEDLPDQFSEPCLGLNFSRQVQKNIEVLDKFHDELVIYVGSELCKFRNIDVDNRKLVFLPPETANQKSDAVIIVSWFLCRKYDCCLIHLFWFFWIFVIFDIGDVHHQWPTSVASVVQVK